MENSARILISGASGFIGTSLVRACPARGFSFTQLVRQPTAAATTPQIVWAPYQSPALPDPSLLEGFDAVIHLSGANVAAHRWTAAYKKEIVESRVRTTQALARMLAQLKHPPRALLCASATGIYGDSGDELLTESSPAGSGFLAETCIAWEVATQPAIGIRIAHMRFGVVLSPEGGALAKMLPLFRIGAGGRLGSGKQWMTWISLPDLISAIFHLLHAEICGPINFVAPTPVTNAEFTRTLAEALRRPAIVPAPAFALRLALGEMADEALLASQRVLPDKLTQSGFRFEHPDMATALQALLKKST